MVAAKKLYESHSGDDAKEAYVVAKDEYLQKLGLQLQRASDTMKEARNRYDDVADISRPYT